MAIIYTYPVKASPVDGDLVLISDSADSNNTKQVKISSIRGATVSGVADVNISAVTSTLSSGAPLVSLPNSGNVIITSRAYAGAANVGHVPTGGSATTFLRGDGSWIVPTNTTYDVMGSGNSYAAGLVLAGNATHNNNFLRKDGTWASPTGGSNSQVQFNNAGSFSGNDELTYDGVGGLTVGAVGGNKGIVILQGEDGNDSGILKIGHLNSTKYLSLGLGNDTMAASYSIDFPVATPGGNNKILESNSLGVLSWINTPSSSTTPASITGTTAVNTTSFANTPYTFESTNATSGGGAPFATKVSGSSGNKHIAFYLSTLCGSISQNGTSAVAYNTSSDYRLKENVVDITGSVDRLKQLKPSRFNFIADGPSRTVDGFLAHEVSSIVPEAVTGIKDAVDADNNIIPQGIDQSKLVPLLVGAMKELTARIEALEA